MSRLVLLALCVAGCSKSAGNQDKVASPPATPPSAGEVIAVPQGGPAVAPMGRPGEAAQAKAPSPSPSGADDDRYKLKPEEGKLAIEPPADARAGAEAVARIKVTPGKGYHVNTEYPIKLTLTPPAGVTLARDRFVAGGHDKSQGDAAALTEQELVIAVKMTPASSGSYTINGNFKFAVCDKDQCLAKQETIAIALAAK